MSRWPVGVARAVRYPSGAGCTGVTEARPQCDNLSSRAHQNLRAADALLLRPRSSVRSSSGIELAPENRGPLWAVQSKQGEAYEICKWTPVRVLHRWLVGWRLRQSPTG